MTKYKIICKACNSIFGYTENPATANMPTKCPNCDMERMAIEIVAGDIVSSLEFDLLITNKRTGASKRDGSIISIDEMTGKTDKEISNLFLHKMAESLGRVLNKPGNIVEILKNGGDKQW